MTDFEAQLGTHFTYETLAYLVRRCAEVRFVWIMGADNLRSFHRWQRWRDIAHLVPIAVVDRFGAEPLLDGKRLRPGDGRFRLPEFAALTLPQRKPPAWYSCMASNRRCPRPPCGPQGQKAVETINPACLILKAHPDLAFRVGWNDKDVSEQKGKAGAKG